MPIRWKVTKQNRTSCIVFNNSYSKKYLKDTIVKAKPNTLGIFTFETKKAAEDFTRGWAWLILKVKGIGRGIKPKKVSKFYGSDDLSVFYEGCLYDIEAPPPGTICYPAVEVLT